MWYSTFTYLSEQDISTLIKITLKLSWKQKETEDKSLINSTSTNNHGELIDNVSFVGDNEFSTVLVGDTQHDL